MCCICKVAFLLIRNKSALHVQSSFSCLLDLLLLLLFFFLPSIVLLDFIFSLAVAKSI